MADVSIDISALDRGGRALIAGITQALRALRSEQAKQAEASRNQAQQSKAVATSLAEQSRVAKQTVIDEQNRLRAVQAASTQRIAAIRKERDEEVAAAKAIARAQNEAAAFFRKQAEERLKAAQAIRKVQTPQGLISLPVDRAQVAARRRELAEQNENVARAAALGRQQIAQAKQSGAAQIQAARQTVTAQQQVVAGARQQATAQAQAARQANIAANQQQAAAQRAANALQRQSQAMQTTANIGAQLRNTILRLVAAYSGFRAIEGFISAGLRFNQIIESSKLGIGALITAEADLFDQQGRQLTGTNALAAAQGLAADQLDKLRVAGIQTAATTEDLVTAFEEAVGAGLAVGLNLDQIRKFTVSIAQAASAIHLPMNQLQQETRSILQGTIDRNSRIAKALQLTNAEVTLAKEQGRLADLLNEKFKAFNLAGAESVKTFGALKSNIQDAFSVFAGRATEPLFRQIRDAGVSALSSIFDFRSADIAQSFQGLIQGLQTIFNQIGGLLADAIRGAVLKAQDLSAWLARNREEVKATAAAIRTMVEDFGKMVSAVVSAVAAVGSLGNQTNTVIGAARVLSAVFQSIADNVGLIVSLLTARALIGALMNIAAIFTAVSSGAAATTVGGPIAGLIAVILTLGASYKLLTGFQKEVQLETARTTTKFEDQAQKAAELAGQITSLERQLRVKGNTTEEVANIEAQLADKLQQVRDLGPDYVRAINEGSDAIEERRKRLEALLKQQAMQLAFQALAAQEELDQLRQRRAEAAAERHTRVIPGDRGEAPSFIATIGDPKKVGELDRQISVADARVQRLTESFNKLNRAITDAFTAPAKIVRHPGTGAGSATDLNDAVQRAQAQLEIVRSTNEANQSLIQIQFKNGLKTQIDVINAESDAAKAEIDAEIKLLEAQRDLAAHRMINKKLVPDQGAIDADNAKITALQNKRVIIAQETEEKIDGVHRDHAEARAKIDEDFARNTGHRMEAIRMEIERKHQKELEDAIREHGLTSEEVVKIKFNIDQESIREQAQAIEGEIRRIEENVQREIATAKLRILGPNAERGSGNAQQKQQLADAISAANRKGVESSQELLHWLNLLKATAADDGDRTFIQSLIDQINLLKKKSVETDDQMKRLKDGISEAFVSGIGGFLDSLTDKTVTLAQSFKNMVTSILSDISRLVSRLIAEKIVFGIIGKAEGGQAGNQTQSQGRAAGGLGRPPHGQLKGGIPGTDSIHIAAMPEEYFVKVPAVRYYGTEFMDAINNMQLPRVNARNFRGMAIGGGAMEPATATARPSARQDVHHHISVDDDGLLRVLRGRPGREATLGHIQKNPRFVSGAVNQGRKR